MSERVSGIDFIVHGLLARARAEADDSAVPFRTLRLDQLVEVTVEDLPSRDRVDVDTQASIVTGNADLIGQAVRNLVENALLHAPGSTVRVRVDGLRVTVTDSGQPAGHTHEATTTAARSGTSSGRTRHRGTGTGLSIVTWVADVHGADLRFESQPDGGTRVALLFPPPRT